MNTITLDQLVNMCINDYENTYKPKKVLCSKNISKCEIPISTEKGYLKISVVTRLGEIPIQDANVTVYIGKEREEESLIKNYTTDENGNIPTIELPVAHGTENLIEGPEYYFSTYNLRIEALNYFTVYILNIRMFPEITNIFDINMITYTGLPLGIEEIIYTPPHPRDIQQ